MGCSYIFNPHHSSKKGLISLMTTALIDGNNFYAACEQSVDPSLQKRPLVILSNNDGCVIARNAEAKVLKIPMGQPFFKIRKKLEMFEVEVRSSNYALYGDMSKRLMTLLRAHCEELEVYSIDEAFASIRRPINQDLQAWAKNLRALIYQNLGLPIAVGIGANKSQAKIANYLAKTIANHAGFFDFEINRNPEYWLEIIAIENVWGIGHKLAYWCRTKGIKNALQLRDMPSNALKAKCGVTGIRLQNELRGISCIPIMSKQRTKKETCVSRSFSHPITSLSELKQAIATYTILASEKLRKQNQFAGTITVFVRTSLHTSIFYSRSTTERLDVHSNNTFTLLKTSLRLTEKVFQANRLLRKAGVIMQDLLNSDYLQLHLLREENRKEESRQERLMQTIDRLNMRYGRNTVTWATCGVSPRWSMQRNYLSAASTTQLTQIPIIRI